MYNSILYIPPQNKKFDINDTKRRWVKGYFTNKKKKYKQNDFKTCANVMGRLIHDFKHNIKRKNLNCYENFYHR